MKIYLEIDIRPYLRMWKSKDNGTSNKKVMKKFYELFAQPSYIQVPAVATFKLLQCPTSWPQRNKQTGESPNLSSGTERWSSGLYDSANTV